MTKEKYQQLTDEMLDEYCAIWPDWDLTIPGYAEVQAKEGLLLESKEKEKAKTKNFDKRNRQVLESWEGKGKEKMKNIDLEKAFSEAFNEEYKRPETEEEGYAYVYSRGRNGQWAQTEHSKLDERAYYRTLEAQKKGKVEDAPLTEAEQAAFDEATGAKKKGVDHSLDEAFASAFGSNRSTERLQDLQEATLGDLLLEDLSLGDIRIEESSNGQPFRFRGKALKVNRRNKNNRRYRKEIVEKALGESKGQVMTIRDGHPGKDDTAVSPTIGKVEFGDINAEGWMPYTATLSNTARSRDIQELLRDKVIGSVSLRSRGRTAIAKMDGASIDEVIDLHFRDLDLVTEGSEEGAGVDEILNSAGRGGF